MAVFGALVLLFSLTSVELSPSVSESLLADIHALRKVLSAHGGIPGTLGLSRSNLNSSTGSNNNCTNWSYDNTTIFPNGKFRHEHAFREDYAGFYGERFVDRPYVVHYASGPLAILLSKRLEYCVVHEWGVVECSQCDDVKAHYVFHDQPQVGCQDVPQKLADPTTLPNGSLLEAQVGVWPAPQDPNNFTDSNFNALPLLEYYGGAPGFVTASRVRPFNVSSDFASDYDDDASEEWLYDYRFSNASTAVRFEHALLRSSDSGDLYEDILGSFYWRSAGGDYFIKYRQNQTGFYSTVQTASIAVYRSLWAVTTPPNKVCA